MASSVERPNIRIEIRNNVPETEAMDVDGDEEEEGEISDGPTEPQQPRGSSLSGDVVGVAEKLAERARRFELSSDQSGAYSQTDLEQLYMSLGINGTGTAENLIPDTILLRGAPSLTSTDILDYFQRYVPLKLGRSDDGTCSIRFSDSDSAVRALLELSRPIDGVPVRRPTGPVATGPVITKPSTTDGKSILLRDRHVELDEPDDGTVDEGVADDFEPVVPAGPVVKLDGSVDVSEVEVPIPDGYWRLTGPMGADKTGALVRFGSRTDKKPFKTESLARGYKKPSQITERQMRELRSIFQRNRDINREKNPWGNLARSWDEDRQREPDRRPEPVAPDRFEVKNPELLERLGKKTLEDREASTPEPPEGAPVSKRSKLPRMRMYADEEEERVRRKRLLRTLNAQESRLARPPGGAEEGSLDLRRTLKAVRRADVEGEHDRQDLSLRLRNRTRGMVFAVRAEVGDEEGAVEGAETEERSDARSLLDKRRSVRRKPVEVRKSPPTRRTMSQELYRAHARDHETRSRRGRPERRSPSRGSSDPKPRSRVAVVVHKAPTRPTVASTIWRPESYTSSSDSSSSSDDSDESSESSEEEVEQKRSGGRVKVRLGARR